MSDTLLNTVNALNQSASRIANITSNIVNASSTGSDGDIATNAVKLIGEKTQYTAESKVIKAVADNNKRLLDILA